MTDFTIGFLHYVFVWLVNGCRDRVRNYDVYSYACGAFNANGRGNDDGAASTILIVWVVYCYELNALRRNGLSEKYWCVQVYVYALSQRSHLSFGVDPSVMHTVYTSIIYQYFPVVITMIIMIMMKCHAPERENKLLNKERHCSNIKLLWSNALFGGLHLLHSQFHWIRNDSHEHMEQRLCTSIRAHRSTVYIDNK